MSDDERETDAEIASKQYPYLTRRRALAAGGVALGTTVFGGSTLASSHGNGDDESGGEGDESGGEGDAGHEYRVTVTNLTSGQPFTPPAVALHQPSVEVFSVGDPANEPVQQIAENGNLDPLVSLIESTSAIRAAGVGEAPLVPSADPGGTGNPYYTTLTIAADESATHLTFISMLIGTNDGFVGLDTVELPEEVNESKTLHANGYDAGTEQNTERFADMVPPAQALIQGGEDDAGTTESNPDIAEDAVIRPHPGITGGADLDPATYGWDEPAASVHVEKIAGDE